jgi:hypothetical protein
VRTRCGILPPFGAVTSDGLKVAFFYAKLYLRILRPNWAALLSLHKSFAAGGAGIVWPVVDRIKPDLVAPGEKVISCESSSTPEAKQRRKSARSRANEIAARYCENSGTSQAAPHVSGAIAAFLSIRREFLHRPEEVKRVFMSSATDLNRERYFQGRGLVDVMRAIQSV